MILTKEYIEERRNAHVPTRLLHDGRQLWLYPMLFTDRLAIGKVGDPCYDDYWCFDDPIMAYSQFMTWDPTNPETPEPTGWIKHPRSGRTRKTNKGEHDADSD
jgi:hypothetical protein